jgi:hypothetical protein
MYPGLVASADVLGFDLYPLQNWCRFDSFGDVFDSQLDLVALARGKPTFQWIEARQMDCSGTELDPTPSPAAPMRSATSRTTGVPRSAGRSRR